VSATVDANVLIYASDLSSPFHERARALIDGLARGPDLLYLFWPTTLAYLRVTTHPAVFERPLSIGEAWQNIDQLLRRPHVRTPGEGDRFGHLLGTVIGEATPRGNLVPDAHLVTLMREHGIRVIWTRDRDFRRFEGIDPRDPFGRAR
jgi:uncharacterized protein